MHGTGGNEPDIELLRERLSLGIATFRRPRGLAVLSVHIQPRAGSTPLPDGVGPMLERELMRRIHKCLRPSDSIARVDELRFVVLLERAEDGPFAMHAADRVVQAVDSFGAFGAHVLELSASVGISMHPDDGDDLDELFRCADAAAEAAEAGGGSLFGFYSQPLNVRAQRRARVERALVGALERGEFELHYQPQLDTRDGSLVAVEALLRFHSIALGAVGPDEFIPVLESTGAIEQVGAWVLQTACSQAAKWASAGRGVRMGVNVSARQLAAAGFEETVAEALQRSGLEPRLLELELTESVLCDNAAETRKLIEGIRGKGMRVALDDFGTGYASLAYIRQFPMDKLKIDRQFVRGLPVDAEAVAITSAIVALARSLRLDIVAEGVEHEAEEEFLHTQHCFVVQGFLHARPMRGSDLEEWRAKRPWA